MGEESDTRGYAFRFYGKDGTTADVVVDFLKLPFSQRTYAYAQTHAIKSVIQGLGTEWIDRERDHPFTTKRIEGI